VTFPVFVPDDVDGALRRQGMRLSEDSLEPTEVAPGTWLVRALGLLSREFVAEVHAKCVKGEWSIHPLPGAPKWRRAVVGTELPPGETDPLMRRGR